MGNREANGKRHTLLVGLRESYMTFLESTFGNVDRKSLKDAHSGQQILFLGVCSKETTCDVNKNEHIQTLPTVQTRAVKNGN